MSSSEKIGFNPTQDCVDCGISSLVFNGKWPEYEVVFNSYNDAKNAASEYFDDNCDTHNILSYTVKLPNFEVSSGEQICTDEDVLTALENSFPNFRLSLSSVNEGITISLVGLASEKDKLQKVLLIIGLIYQIVSKKYAGYITRSCKGPVQSKTILPDGTYESGMVCPVLAKEFGVTATANLP